MAAIKGLIFDLDGTIIDNYDEYMESMLLRVGTEIGYPFTLRHAQELWYSIGAESRDAVIRRWGLIPDQFWTVFNKYESLEEKLQNTYLHRDAAFLKHLALPKGIVTHTALDHTTGLLELLGMRRYFTSIVACTEDTGYKPSPLPLIYCVIEMGLRPEDVAYVGDTVSDMMAAEAAGIRSVYINRFNRPIAFRPDHEINSLEQLADILAPDPVTFCSSGPAGRSGP